MLGAMLWGQEWVLIVRQDADLRALHAEEIREIYLGKRHFVDNVRILPLQLEADDTLRQQFENEIVRMPRPALREWWIRRHYLGQRPPRVVGSAEAVIAYVKKVEGSMGYVPAVLAEDANVTIVYRGGKKP